MSRYWQIITLTLCVFLASCANKEQVYVYKGSTSNAGQTEIKSTESSSERQAEAEETEPEIVAQERERIAEAKERQRQAELAARDAAEEARKEAARQEEMAKIAQEQAAAAEAERLQQVQAEQALAKQQAQALAQQEELARQEARVAELRAKINAANTKTVNLEAANTTLQDAVLAAEDFSEALSVEQEKYTQVDPATGEPVQALDPQILEELSQKVEQLKAQAAALASATQ